MDRLGGRGVDIEGRHIRRPADDLEHLDPALVLGEQLGGAAGTILAFFQVTAGAPGVVVVQLAGEMTVVLFVGQAPIHGFIPGRRGVPAFWRRSSRSAAT